MCKLYSINTLDAPQVLGAYSQGIKIKSDSSLIFVAGQLPIDPKSGKLIDGGIEQMTAQVMKNIQAILKAGGSELNRVVRVEVFLTDIDNFTLLNSEYAKYFTGMDLPARQVIEVSRLPLNSPIEISCIAIADV